MQTRMIAVLAPLALVLLWSSARQARGDVSVYDTFKNIEYTQTSNAQPTTPSLFFVDADVDSTLPNDLTGGSVTNASTASISLSVVSPTALGGNATYGSLADMNAAFGDGSTNSFSVSSSSLGTLTDSLVQPASGLFTSNIPYLTNFSQLQGMNPTQAFTVDFPSTQAVVGSSSSAIYFSIFGTSVSFAALPDSSTSFVIPANTLLPNTTYTFEIDYSNRLSSPATGGFSGATGFAAYDVRTDGTFTTGSATPEPASLTLFGAGALAMLGVGRRRKDAGRMKDEG